MDLHGGAPWWLIQHELTPSVAPLVGEHRCEVLVIGAGLTGALVADAMTSRGHDVIVVDRRDPGLGSTAASTALLQYEIDVELAEQVEQVGIPHAVRASETVWTDRWAAATRPAAMLTASCPPAPGSGPTG